MKARLVRGNDEVVNMDSSIKESYARTELSRLLMENMQPLVESMKHIVILDSLNISNVISKNINLNNFNKKYDENLALLFKQMLSAEHQKVFMYLHNKYNYSNQVVEYNIINNLLEISRKILNIICQ